MKDKFKETLTHILSYLLKVERRTLLWTNPSNIYGAGTVALDLGVVRKLLKALKPLTLGRGWAV